MQPSQHCFESRMLIPACFRKAVGFITITDCVQSSSTSSGPLGVTELSALDLFSLQDAVHAPPEGLECTPPEGASRYLVRPSVAIWYVDSGHFALRTTTFHVTPSAFCIAKHLGAAVHVFPRVFIKCRTLTVVGGDAIIVLLCSAQRHTTSPIAWSAVRSSSPMSANPLLLSGR